MRSFNLLRKFTPEQVQETDLVEDFRDEQVSFHERSPFYKVYKQSSNGGHKCWLLRTVCRTNITTKVGVGHSCGNMPLYCLWSAFGNPLRKRFSNAVAENNFRHIRHDILGRATNLKPTLFIDKIEQRHSALQMPFTRAFYAKKVKPKAQEVRAFWLKRDKKKSTYFMNLRNKQLLENIGHELPKVIMKTVQIWLNSLPKDPKYFYISGMDNVIVAKVGSAELHLEDLSSTKGVALFRTNRFSS